MKLLLSVLIFFATTSIDDSVQVQLVGFSNDKGKAYVRVRDAKDTIVSQQIVSIKDKVASFSIPVSGLTSIAVDAYHDENGNGKMDFNLFGAPSEAWGVSSENRPMLRAPTLEEILVTVKKGSVVTVKMK